MLLNFLCIFFVTELISLRRSSLSSAEVSLCHREAGEKKKSKRARLFSIIVIFIGMPSGSASAEERLGGIFPKHFSSQLEISCLTSYQPVFCNDTLSPTIILAHTNHCHFTLF